MAARTARATRRMKTIMPSESLGRDGSSSTHCASASPGASSCRDTNVHDDSQPICADDATRCDCPLPRTTVDDRFSSASAQKMAGLSNGDDSGALLETLEI